MTIRLTIAAAALALLAAPCFAADAQLAAAIASHDRAPENSKRDGARHPGAKTEKSTPIHFFHCHHCPFTTVSAGIWCGDCLAAASTDSPIAVTSRP